VLIPSNRNARTELHDVSRTGIGKGVFLCAVTGPLNIIDTKAQSGVPRYFKESFAGTPAIVFVACHPQAIGNKFAEWLGLDKKEHSATHYAAVRLAITQVVIPNVIGLREPAVAGPSASRERSQSQVRIRQTIDW
jgi:hypothetical protein